jgi:hypothetical protein
MEAGLGSITMDGFICQTIVEENGARSGLFFNPQAIDIINLLK